MGFYGGAIGGGLGEEPPGRPPFRPHHPGPLLRPAPLHASPQRRSNAASSARHPYQMNSAQLSSRAARVSGEVGGGCLFIQHYSRPRDPSRFAFWPPHTDLQVRWHPFYFLPPASSPPSSSSSDLVSFSYLLPRCRVSFLLHCPPLVLMTCPTSLSLHQQSSLHFFL